MDQNLEQRLKNIEEKLERVFQSAEKTRKYFLYMIIGSVIVIVLPIFGLVFAIPSFLDTYNTLGF